MPFLCVKLNILWSLHIQIHFILCKKEKSGAPHTMSEKEKQGNAAGLAQRSKGLEENQRHDDVR